MKKLKLVLYGKLSKFPYLSKRTVLFVDLLLVGIAFTLTYFFYILAIDMAFSWRNFLFNIGVCLFVNLFTFLYFKTYTGIIRYSTFRDALKIFNALLVANAILLLISLLARYISFWPEFPLSGYFVNMVIAFSMCFFLRMVVKLVYEFARRSTSEKERIPILINGASTQLIDFARVLNNGQSYKVVGFFSKDDTVINKKILGLPVYSKEEIKKQMAAKNTIFKAILINPKEIDRGEKQQILDLCFQYNIELLSTPDWNDWRENSKMETRLQKIRIEDLLGRIPIAINIELIANNLKGKTIMVTGAGGSIGSEIVRQLSQFDIGMIMLCDTAETPVHELGLELDEKFPETPYISKICNVQDYVQMKHIIGKYKPDYIYHAAAYKHVPLMENHPCEAVLTNVLGSKNIIDLAIENQVEVFVMISTDKAVNPSNVMGAAKRVAEIYVQSLYKKLKDERANPTRIITTRFGNVLGSNGSVIPYFKKQIEKGGPVTVTHEDIIRYFMTIPEACRLVLEAGNMGKGGEVFLFDMGDSVRIKDLAEKMIRLAGLEPYKDIDIVYTGLRPGEKLYEEMLYDKEKVQPTTNKKIVVGTVREYDYDEVSAEINELIRIAYSYDKNELVRKMKKIVPEFISHNSIYTTFDEVEN